MSDSLVDFFLEESPILLATKREVYIAIRRDGGIGADGTKENPLDGSASAKLDFILKADPANPYAKPNTRFIFGPGIFETQGGPGLNRFATDFAWQPLAGCEFVGAGMYQTTLRLKMNSVISGAGYFAISSLIDNRTDGFVISDMTIDCNLENQPPSIADDRSDEVYKPPFPFAAAGFGAINVFGHNITIRRVRVINGGSRFPAFGASEGIGIFPNSESAVQNFRIENCIFERPYHSRARELPFTAMTGTGPYEHCAIRNNYFDGAIVNPGPFPLISVQSLVSNGTTATLVTMAQHDLKKGDKVTIAGAGAQNGDYDITTDPIDQWTVVLSNVPSGTAPAGATAQKYSKPTLRATSLTSAADLNPSKNRIATLTTPVPHLRVAGGANFVFNNRTLSGTFLPVTIIDSSFHQGELTTDAELMYASL